MEKSKEYYQKYAMENGGEICRRIVEQRKKNTSFKQLNVACEYGVSESMISKYERFPQLLTVPFLYCCEEMFHTSLAYLITGHELSDENVLSGALSKIVNILRERSDAECEMILVIVESIILSNDFRIEKKSRH